MIRIIEAEEFFRKELSRQTVFRISNSLDLGFVPERLHCRDSVISDLIQTFRGVIDCKGLYSSNCLILGKGGCGKTTSVKFFCKNFKKVALERGMEINTQYFNCVDFDTESRIIRKLFEIFLFHSGRGYSNEEALHCIVRNMKYRKMYLILVLDEVHLLPVDEVWSLLNVAETFGHHNVRISIILVSRLFDWKNIENERLLSRIDKRIILKPYSLKEAGRILSYRYEIAFRDGLLGREGIEFISSIVERSKNLRHGVEILKLCGQYANKKYLNKIDNNIIKKIARQVVYSDFRADIFDKLKMHEAITFYALLKAYRDRDGKFVTTDISFNNYITICKNLGIKPHIKLTFNMYIRKLNKTHLITSRLTRNKNSERGMHSQISLNLNRELSQILERDIKKYIRDKYYQDKSIF